MSVEKRPPHPAALPVVRSPHPATVQRRAAPFGMPKAPSPHPATAQRATVQPRPPHPARATTVQRTAKDEKKRDEEPDDEHPDVIAHAAGRYLSREGHLLGSLAEIVVAYAKASLSVYRFTVSIEGGKLLGDSKTPHAEHKYAISGMERAYGLNPWTNQKGDIVSRIQAGFRSIHQMSSPRDLLSIVESFATLQDRYWLDVLLEHYVLKQGHDANWYQAKSFDLALRFPLEERETVRETFAVHLIYLRVTSYYREKSMKTLGTGRDYARLLQTMATFMFSHHALTQVLEQVASASGGNNLKVLKGILSAEASAPKEKSLFSLLTTVPSDDNDDEHDDKSKKLWNMIVAYLVQAKLAETGGFLGSPQTKADLNHLRFRVYQEWRTVYELLSAYQRMRSGRKPRDDDKGSMGKMVETSTGGHIVDPVRGKLAISRVPGGGNCLFSALIQCGLDTKIEDPDALRAWVADKIGDRRAAARVRAYRSYVDTDDLDAVARALGRCIVLYEGYYGFDAYHARSVHGNPAHPRVNILLRSFRGELEGHYDALLPVKGEFKEA